ncbi:prepilin-type N-terminal cleavage/methylation domain-containing protein [Mahella sp.]|uniref:PilW family protein n=1 Tax=Mahella sp. TaxID=2798721 RepID=UPI0025BC36E2|nr:prepilin-type N-terminal cleavage/methylation domain-containing protein [Mahella sp.]MBZ4665933.1 hypothetical protein [Mahella sp.]
MRHKGFTLVEVLITVALFSVLVAVVFSMYFVGTKTFTIAADQSFAQKYARTAADFISKELRTAKDISADAGKFSGQDYYILQLKDKDGQRYLVKTTRTASGQTSDAFIVPLNQIAFSANNSNMVNINVTASDGRDYDINFSIRLENISAVSIQQGSAVIYYSIY